jgi:hypothetical protein
LVWLVVVVVVVVAAGVLEASGAARSEAAVVSDWVVVVVVEVSEVAVSLVLLLLQPPIENASPSAIIVAKAVRWFMGCPSCPGHLNGHGPVKVPEQIAFGGAPAHAQ